MLERLAGYFDGEETEIAAMVGRDKTEKLISKPQHPSFSGIPLSVLVDSESASASETLARHLQRTGRAIIIGDKTAGEVSVARAFEQKIGFDPAVFNGVQTTVAHLIFPDGKDLEKSASRRTRCVFPRRLIWPPKKIPAWRSQSPPSRQDLTPRRMPIRNEHGRSGGRSEDRQENFSTEESGGAGRNRTDV